MLSEPSAAARPDSLWAEIAIYGCLSAIAASAVLAAGTELEVKDSNLRAVLARRGVHTVATITGGECKKRRRSLEVSFLASNGRMETQCILDAFVSVHPPYDFALSKLDVTYDPLDPSSVYMSPNGHLPQHNVNGIWLRWLHQTLWASAIVWSIITLALWRKHRKDSGLRR